MWYTYLILCEDGSIYTGVTNNLRNRFRNHLEGRGGHYTRAHKPVRLLYSEQFATKGEALQREGQIKGWRREKKLSLIKFGRPTP